MRELPSGTVTFLFTDIEGSTRLLHELGDGYADALADHRRTLRAAVTAHGGVEVDTQGDAFFTAFARASEAVSAAADIQRRLAAGPVYVRIGLHTGEPLLTDEGYVGLDLHRGARICAAGHGGQVLLSRTTRDLVDANVLDLGEHRLKDLLEPQSLYQLGSETFPPLKTLNWTNLPVQATPIVGRERELAEAALLLHENRLLTLVGPPGTGKTRLALQLAAECAEDFEQVWWVGLQQIHDPDLVEPTIARTVGARSDLVGFLRDRRALLLLDNLEQVLECAPRLAELVNDAGGVKVLATSREPLRLKIEQQFPVAPLPESDAATLFSERARAVRPGFAANGAVADICRRLDGLPLAIELAAARVKLLAPDALLARLEQRLPLLTGGPRDLPERQQTLTATIAWSYDLLDPQEQVAMARLAVFAGGWTLEAAEAVCDCTLETLAGLVDKSLVRERDGRFSMLETIGEYAVDRLSELGGAGEARSRHAAYYLAGAEDHSGEGFRDLEREDVDWFEGEHDNVRAALDWLSGHETEADSELRLTKTCGLFWVKRGYWTEGRQRTEAALGRAGKPRTLLHAQSLRLASEFAWRQGAAERGKELAEAALALFDELGTTGSDLAGAYIGLANCEDVLGNRREATELYERARAAGDDRVAAMILGNLGNIALNDDDLARARGYFEQSAALARRLKFKDELANTLVDLGFLALAEDRIEEALAAFRESLDICRDQRITELLIWVLEGLAAVALQRRQLPEATRLLGATARPRSDLAFGAAFYPTGEEMRERTLDALRTGLGEERFTAAYAEGEALALDEAAEAAERVG
jgi:predicted ATPase/tetratricopeptide (TPR) repeat protein